MKRSNIIDASARLTKKRKFDQFLIGVMHQETYEADAFKKNDPPTKCSVDIELWSWTGNNPGLHISVGNESWLVTLTRAQAVQLAKDLFSSIE